MSEQLMDFDQVMELYEPVLGLEVHVELNTKSKMWCGCSTDSTNVQPNTNVCPVCLGLPGSLPVINAKAVESAIRIGLSLGCQIADSCRMARKNYFYPDMTKNYQISQSDEPIALNGQVEIDIEGEQFQIPIERAHMEEDAGKSSHVGGLAGRIQGAQYSLLDYNRAGLPLIEIVTKPIFGTGRRAPEVGRYYMSYLRDLMRALRVSNARMELGNMRCDANVSLMPKGSNVLGTRTETKNVNSLKSVERALRYEICRQGAILASGGKVKQETRMWNDQGGFTTAGRSKETAEDYRYFPEPDLVPIQPGRDWVENLRLALPEPPAKRRDRLQNEWGFSDAEMRDVVNAEALDLIEETIKAGCDAQSARKWWLTELSRQANEAEIGIEDLPITPADVAEVQNLIDKKTINDKLARQVLVCVVAGKGSPSEIVQSEGLSVVSDDSSLLEAIDQAIEANPDVVEKIKGGKPQAAGALIGSVMKQLKGKADAKRVRELIVERLGN